jgi:hypothetical protein
MAAQLQKIDEAIDELFRYREIGTDPAFSRFIPMVYDPIKFNWREEFQTEFNQLFNGLMLRGDEEVGRIFLAVFPTDRYSLILLKTAILEISYLCIILL